jgi:hypothetical protein
MHELSSAGTHRTHSELFMNCFISSCGYISFILTSVGMFVQLTDGTLVQTVQQLIK